MLAIIQVGHNDASDRYVRNKVKAVEKAGMEAKVVNLPEDASQSDVLYEVAMANDDDSVSAIIVQLPLPYNINPEIATMFIDRDKDIDGLSASPYYRPLTPTAIFNWLNEQGIDVEGKDVVIFGRSKLVGLPLAEMLIEEGATVTVCNSHTNLESARRLAMNADIIVSATGTIDPYGVIWKPKEHQIVIDVGINRDKDGKLCGDISEENRYGIVERAKGYCTPVPGGVGKWTVRELVLRLEEMENGRKE